MKQAAAEHHHDANEALYGAPDEDTFYALLKEKIDSIDYDSLSDEDKKDGKIWIVKLLSLTGIASSNGEARRLIAGGGISIDGEKVSDEKFEINFPCNCVIKAGKRRFVRVIG